MLPPRRLRGQKKACGDSLEGIELRAGGVVRRWRRADEAIPIHIGRADVLPIFNSSREFFFLSLRPPNTLRIRGGPCLVPVRLSRRLGRTLLPQYTIFHGHGLGNF
jgi:hypothetical protein